jgi:hypothetical protein
MSEKMKWALRLLALASTTVCGIAFLFFAIGLLLNYNYEYHRFLPFVVEEGYITDTIWLGFGLLCSLILYIFLVRKMRPTLK